MGEGDAGRDVAGCATPSPGAARHPLPLAGYGMHTSLACATHWKKRTFRRHSREGGNPDLSIRFVWQTLDPRLRGDDERIVYFQLVALRKRCVNPVARLRERGSQGSPGLWAWNIKDCPANGRGGTPSPILSPGGLQYSHIFGLGNPLEEKELSSVIPAKAGIQTYP
jgi:hypothetical protein